MQTLASSQNLKSKLLRDFLEKEYVNLYDLAPGMSVLTRPDTPPSKHLFVCTVRWDPDKWTLGKKNPRTCVQQFTVSVLENAEESLVSILKNIFTPNPNENGLDFYENAPRLNLSDLLAN